MNLLSSSGDVFEVMFNNSDSQRNYKEFVVLTNIHPGIQHIYTLEANFKTSSTQAVNLPEKLKGIVYLTVCIAFVHRAVQHIPSWISKVITTGNSHLRMMINTSPCKARMVP
jgi:hypothetical protein